VYACRCRWQAPLLLAQWVVQAKDIWALQPIGTE